MALAKALQNAQKTKQATDQNRTNINSNLTNRLDRQASSLPNGIDALETFKVFNMESKLNEAKSERELQHKTLKLNDMENELNKSIKVINKLKKQNEQLITLKEMHQNEIKTLKERNKILQDMYDIDTTKQKQQINTIKKQLYELKYDIKQKNNELNEVNKFQISMHFDEQSTNKFYSDDDKKNDENTLTKNENISKNGIQIDKLLLELNELRKLKTDKLCLQNEINKLNEMAQSDLNEMNEEIIELKSKNDGLQRDKDELMILLEEAKMSNINGHIIRNGGGNYDINHKLSFCSDQSSLSQNGIINLEEYDEKHDFMEYGEYENDKLNAPLTLKPKKEKKIADVEKEYLNITATVVKMKFGRNVPHIDTNQLIEKVKNFNICQWHDVMVAIMKHEEKKLRQKQREKNGDIDDKKKKKGIFNKFKRSFSIK